MHWHGHGHGEVRVMMVVMMMKVKAMNDGSGQRSEGKEERTKELGDLRCFYSQAFAGRF